MIQSSLEFIILQSVRYVFHELATPLNSLAIGLDSLKTQKLTKGGEETLLTAKTHCDTILSSMQEIRYLQVV